MAPRVTRRRCRNCPDDVESSAAPLETKTTRRQPDVDAKKMWQCGLYACGVLITLLDGLVVLDLPGDVLPQLRKLYTKLGLVIDEREKRYADSSPQE